MALLNFQACLLPEVIVCHSPLSCKIKFLSSLLKKRRILVLGFLFFHENVPCGAKLVVSFHRKCLSINFRVSQIEKTGSQRTLALAGILATAVETLFSVSCCCCPCFICRSHIRLLYNVGARLKCGIIYIFVRMGVCEGGCGKAVCFS